MESEEAYKHSKDCGNPHCEMCNYNRGYAEGRKSVEKDFKELLELANRIEEFYPGRYAHVEKFKAWKKARGIE